MVELIGIGMTAAQRILPWFGAVLGLALIVAGETAKPGVGYLSHRHLQRIGIGLVGVSVGALASGF
jgi:hypothetical protein